MTLENSIPIDEAPSSWDMWSMVLISSDKVGRKDATWHADRHASFNLPLDIRYVRVIPFHFLALIYIRHQMESKRLLARLACSEHCMTWSDKIERWSGQSFTWWRHLDVTWQEERRLFMSSLEKLSKYLSWSQAFIWYKFIELSMEALIAQPILMSYP